MKLPRLLYNLGSTVTEHSATNRKIKGLHAATGTGREKIAEILIPGTVVFDCDSYLTSEVTILAPTQALPWERRLKGKLF